MTYEQLTLSERVRIERAFSQAKYFAERGFRDHCAMYAPQVPADIRSAMSGVVARFLLQHVTSDLSAVVAGLCDRRGSVPMVEEFRDTSSTVIDITEGL